MNIQTKRTHRLVAILALGLGLTLALLWLVQGEGPKAHAASFTVTTFADSNDGSCDTDCSLREAIVAANATSEADTIILPAGTYILRLAGAYEDAAATGDLDITAPLTILGQGSGQTVVDAGGIDRVFDVRPGSTPVTISGVTIVGGHVTDYGGGVRCDGTNLTLVSAIITSSIGEDGGGGLYARQSSVTLSGTHVISNTAYQGGGIYNHESVLTLTLSSVVLNTSEGSGAGIFSWDGASILSYSTVVSNSADGSGGGIYQSGSAATLSLNSSLVADNFAGSEGGGVFVAVGAWATIENSTISTNRTNRYGGGLNSRIPTTVTHSTITGNVADYDANSDGHGGGVFAYQSGAQLYFRHTIVANNADLTSAAYNDCLLSNGSVTSQGYNLVETVGNCTFGATGDITGQDPGLGPLQDNGGATWTHALLTGSPAIDAGDPAFSPPPEYDQRGPGFARVINERIDIGAYEASLNAYLPLVLRND
ncbi:MAG: CSLREA domain-containing protein [Anaerolineae bacterium]|nr:CSLREA domain-containing protein [Anaerolineae bacterium]